MSLSVKFTLHGKGQGVQGRDLGRIVVMDLMEKFLDKGYVLFMELLFFSPSVPKA